MDSGKKISKLLEEGYKVNFGDYLARAWKILIGNAGTFIVYTLLMFVIFVICIIIPILGWLALLIVVPAFSTGYYYLAREAATEGYAEIKTGFAGFSNIGRVLPLFLLMFIIRIIASIPYYATVGPILFEFYKDLLSDPASMVGAQPPSTGWFWILQIIPYYFTIAYFFAYPLVLFTDMSIWKAMEASRKVITKKWFIFLALYIVASIMSGMGVILFLIGVLFTAPLISLVKYAAYEDIVGFEDDEYEEDELDHLIA